MIVAASVESRVSGGSLPGARNNNASVSEIQVILGVLFAILGAIAVLMIVIGGLRYVMSSGDPQKVSKARNTIIYALVGLAVAITAEGLVAFVVNKL